MAPVTTQPRPKKVKRSAWQKHRVAIIIGTIVLLTGFGFAIKAILSGKSSPPPKPPMMVSIKLPPPPPPPPTPPPPPPEPPKPEEKMIEQEPVKEEPKPEPPKAPEPPALGSAIKGEGNDGFGLSGSGDGRIGGTIGGGGGSRSKWGWYAGQVQQSITQALRAHKLTRSASMTITVRVWADATGRIQKATLSGSSGRADIDRALQNEILTGLQLQQAPPEGMPMPIVLRITAQRP